MVHPEFERAEFGYQALQVYRHDVAGRPALERWEIDLQSRGLLEIAFRIIEDVTHFVSGANGRAEEAKTDGLPG